MSLGFCDSFCLDVLEVSLDVLGLSGVPWKPLQVSWSVDCQAPGFSEGFPRFYASGIFRRCCEVSLGFQEVVWIFRRLFQRLGALEVCRFPVVWRSPYILWAFLSVFWGQWLCGGFRGKYSQLPAGAEVVATDLEELPLKLLQASFIALIDLGVLKRIMESSFRLAGCLCPKGWLDSWESDPPKWSLFLLAFHKHCPGGALKEGGGSAILGDPVCDLGG